MLSPQSAAAPSGECERLLILTQYTYVTDRHPGSRTDTARRHRPRYAYSNYSQAKFAVYRRDFQKRTCKPISTIFGRQKLSKYRSLCKNKKKSSFLPHHGSRIGLRVLKNRVRYRTYVSFKKRIRTLRIRVLCPILQAFSQHLRSSA